MPERAQPRFATAAYAAKRSSTSNYVTPSARKKQRNAENEKRGMAVVTQQKEPFKRRAVVVRAQNASKMRYGEAVKQTQREPRR